MRKTDVAGAAAGAATRESHGAEDAVFWMGGDARWSPPGDCPPLTRTTRADVCVVGGGFTGLWAAYWIKRLSADTDVVLLERQFCGAGASGRNGGWVNGWEDALSTLLGRFGREDAMWLLDASLRSGDAIREVVREAEIDCDLAFAEGLNLAMSPAQMESLRSDVRAAEDAGRGDLFRTLSREEVQEACGSPRAVGGVATTHAGSVQPALLVQGLRRAAVDAGVRIFEASPMTYLRRTLPAVVETPAGTVVADRVVLAGGPWMARVPELRRTLFVIPSHMVATSPAGELLDAMGWRRGRPFVDARTAVHYGQRTADDRIVFGRGGGRLGYAGRIIPAHFHDEAEAAEIVGDLHDLFPRTAELAIEWSWGGPVERTQHGTPWVGSLGSHDNVHYGTGYSGNGVCPTQLIGRTLASVALGLDDEYAASPLVSEPPSYLPPEPVRSLGAQAVRAAIGRCEARADKGLAADPVSKFVSRGLDFSMPRPLLRRKSGAPPRR
jgi:glycine/D-amino acid oxidase-like deaminating enzyme